MTLNLKPDEHYIDGNDKWVVQYRVSDDSRVSPGDYKVTIHIVRNGELVGQTIWHKDRDGNDKTKPYEYGIQCAPSTAQRLDRQQL